MEDNAELESFRRQWREEVAQRTRHTRPEAPKPRAPAPTSTPSARLGPLPPTRHAASERQDEDEDDGILAPPADQEEIVRQVGQLSLTDEDAFHSRVPEKEPSSALEHFEKAVQKEEEGSLGDSLQLYRKAYRLDSTVDKSYRDKHFAWAWKRPAQPPASSAPASCTATVKQDEEEPGDLPTSELIASFAHLPIPPAEPAIENTPPPPCPIAKVPSEVVVEILRHVALMDPAAFSRMSLVCKRLAYHFAHEQHIWRRLCQGSEFGFKSMHYSFACDVLGNPEYTLAPRYTPFPFDAPVQIPSSLASWSEVFQMLPRIRFTGVYINTVNYTRPGAASAYQNVSWNSPIHIITYYRYLRFYPDGTVLSLLSSTPPLDVVPYINKENVTAARGTTSSHRQQLQPKSSDPSQTAAGASGPVPPAAMAALKYTHRGRWHLVKPTTLPDPPNPNARPELAPDLPSLPGKAAAAVEPDEPDSRDVIIETEGVGPKYMYTLHLSLRSSSGGSKPANSNASPPNPAKNTKLAWKGYWSYNNLTDDWAEFGLRNDRPFVFRRVRGWGMN